MKKKLIIISDIISDLITSVALCVYFTPLWGLIATAVITRVALGVYFAPLWGSIATAVIACMGVAGGWAAKKYWPIITE